MTLSVNVETTEVVSKNVEFKNFDDVQRVVENALAPYRALDVTTLSPESLKENVKALNKSRKEINDAKLDIQSQCLMQYKVFESKVKELLKSIDDCIKPFQARIDEINATERKPHTFEINLTDAEYDKLIKYLSKGYDFTEV